ncbi:MAG: double-strand break repair helicase AddA [Gemmobacter sp.]
MTGDSPSARQARAADPGASTWVSANAGSGKTKVLIDRVARLLLGGVAPQRILCLTYTKAAAAEMQVRLFARLGGWAMLPEAPLRAALEGLSGQAVGAEGLAQARRLFAQAIETPGGLRIQTIHSFCASLLRRFPLEAGVSPGFVELEDRATVLMMGQVLDDLAEGGAAGVMADLARLFTGDDLVTLARDVAGRRADFAPPLTRAEVRARFGVPQGESEAAILASVFRGNEAGVLAEAVEALASGSVNDLKVAAKLAGIETLSGLPALQALEGALLFGGGAKLPYGPKGRGIATAKTQAAMGEALCGALDDLATRVAEARARRIAWAAAERSAALHAFAAAFLPAFAAAKAARGALDFEDLILKVRGLLSDPGVAPWVLFRLDGGIDHILVDEAQDTSPAQWQIIQTLAEDMTSGRGARPDAPRTLFVVGDRKQSIYSFQGADLRAFGEKQALFRQNFASAGLELQELELPHSFRSSAAVLGLVDATFDPARGPVLDAGMHHIAFRDTMPGRCDLWPAVEKTAEAPPGPWDQPLDTVSEDAPARVLARRIAGFLADLLARGTQVPVPDHPGDSRPLTPGDVLILVRRRSEVFSEIIAALKAARLPVAGADRLKLGGEIAVRDLLAILSVIDLPGDDLSLAAVLRSPLFGWSEDALYRLAQGRPGTLWEALRAQGPGEAAEVLADLMAQADFLRPYDLLERLLTRHGGRRRLLARLGQEAEDGIDAMLAQALAYERDGVPSLTGFLVWTRAEEVEIKRRADAAGGLIRVMTVHGAKGLEAPLVILPDTARRQPPRGGDLIALPDGVPAWKLRAEDRPEALAAAVAALRQSEAEEDMRLLYVAMTRAQSWLVVAAAGDLGKDPDDDPDSDRAPVWYRVVQAGMAAAGATALPDGGMRLTFGDWPPEAAAAPVLAISEPVSAPDWVLVPAPPAPRPPGPVSPSALGGAKALPGEAGLEEDQAKALGAALHRLLEHLPGWPRADWPRLAEALLPEVPERAALLAEAAAVLEAPALAPLFAPGTLAEVPFACDWRARRLVGAIDRLVIGPDRVLAVDFKSNRAVPNAPEAVPEGILRQMGAYAHALDQLFPGRVVEVAILWTGRAVLMPLPRALVDAALLRGVVP